MLPVVYNHINYSQICPCGHLYLAVTCIKRSPFSCSVIDNSIFIEPLLRDHLSYKATFSLSQRWPLNTGLTVVGFLLFPIITDGKVIWQSKRWSFVNLRQFKDSLKSLCYINYWKKQLMLLVGSSFFLNF